MTNDADTFPYRSPLNVEANALPVARTSPVALTYAAVTFPFRSPKMLSAVTFPLVLMLAVALMNDAFTFPVRSPNRLVARTFPVVRVLEVALTKVAVTLPVTSPRNVWAATTPGAVRFPVTSATMRGDIRDDVADTLAPVVFPVMSIARTGGNATFAEVVMPVRREPSPTKNVAVTFPLATTVPAATYGAITLPKNHGAYTFPV